MLSHKAPVLESLHLINRLDKKTPMEMDILIEIAIARNARELVLEIRHHKMFKVPRSLYICETLETLKIKSNSIIDVPSPVCLNSLTTLELRQLMFKDNKSVCTLLSGCPKLENLVVEGYLKYSWEICTIAAPSLQRLSICNSNGEFNRGFMINTPSLKYLKIQGIYSLGVCLIENVTKLVEANITDVCDITNDNILGSLSSVKRLSLDLSPLTITLPFGSIFNKLVYLELNTRKEAWWNLLTLMLDVSPNLQVLKLIDQVGYRKDREAWGKWDQPKNVPDCLLFHLETFMWEGYEWQREDEKEVVEYILRNTNHLKRATISSKPIDSQERAEMVKELESVARASNLCQLLFE